MHCWDLFLGLLRRRHTPLARDASRQNQAQQVLVLGVQHYYVQPLTGPAVANARMGQMGCLLLDGPECGQQNSGMHSTAAPLTRGTRRSSMALSLRLTSSTTHCRRGPAVGLWWDAQQQQLAGTPLRRGAGAAARPCRCA